VDAYSVSDHSRRADFREQHGIRREVHERCYHGGLDWMAGGPLLRSWLRPRDIMTQFVRYQSVARIASDLMQRRRGHPPRSHQSHSTFQSRYSSGHDRVLYREFASANLPFPLDLHLEFQPDGGHRKSFKRSYMPPRYSDRHVAPTTHIDLKPVSQLQVIPNDGGS
jgi:hypothetical protein